MPKDTSFRDYSLIGDNSNGSFTHEQWYASPVPRKRMKELMRRSDKPGLINYSIWLGSIFALGALMIVTWGSWWAVPVTILYGVFYGSGGDSRWHECGHGTVFKTRWLNDFFYQIASFMSLRNPHLWRWSHTRHHTDTIVVGRDPEIAFPRPPSLGQWVLNLIYIPTVIGELGKMGRLAAGQISDAQKDFLPENEWAKTVRVSRIQILILAGVVLMSVVQQSWLPVMLVGLPTFYGSWLHHIMASTQHAGLAEDVPDHRMNSRTVYMNPFFRFIYSNMNYHVEHHMYPMVPFHALPALHDEIKDDCPPAYPSIWAAYKEMIPTVMEQQKDPNHYARRPLPGTANPSPDYVRPIISAE